MHTLRKPGEPNQDILCFVLKALCALYNCHRFKSATELVPNILPTLKMGDSKTSEAAIVFLHSICTNAPEECHKLNLREWLRVAYELVDALVFWGESMRAKAVETLGLISRFVGPQEVLNILMDKLQSDDRQQRNASALGIAAVAEYTGAFSVLPTLLADYAIPSANVRHGILKSIAHIYQRLGTRGRDYVCAVIPVLEDALADDDPAYRSLGLSMARGIILSYKAPVIDTEVLIHILNLMWINILDYTPQVRLAFDECIGALSSVLGSEYLYKYVVQGLFHPAGRVRERYQDVFKEMQRSDGVMLSECFLVEDLPTWHV
jgi:splicing factor 3B subunit 1